MDDENDESWLSLSTMAVYVSKTKWTVTRQTLAKWRDDKTVPFPKSKKFGERKVLYSKQSIDEWLGIHENKLKKRKANKKIDKPKSNHLPEKTNSNNDQDVIFEGPYEANKKYSDNDLF